MSRSSFTIQDAVAEFSDLIQASRSPNTARAYTQGLQRFIEHMSEFGIDTTSPPSRLTLNHFAAFIDTLRSYSPATEHLYILSVKRFYEYLAAEEHLEVNPAKLKTLIQTRSRRQGLRLPQFPRDEIETMVTSALSRSYDGLEGSALLQARRDAAFVVTLADTGLRVHEACNLLRGDFDWDEQKAIVIGKGDYQAIVRFSRRSAHLLTAYLRERSHLDGSSGKPLATLPVFARHDRGAGAKIKPITTTTGRKIVQEAVITTLGKDAVGRITPHSFRHYFVTTVLRSSGGNLKLAQELARHKNVQVTQRYAHLSQEELDRGYHEIFEDDES